MQTNKDWLFSLSLDELYAWFDAEHVDAQQDNNGTCPNDNRTCPDDADSREKLEADVLEYLHNQTYAGSETICEWLDRQAAITENEIGDVLLNQDDRIAELQEQVDELKHERDYWKLHADLWAEKCKEAERERELYRARVSDLLDAIQGAWRVGQREYTLVDMDGEVVS